MNARVSLSVLALAAALVTLGCASGDGVPKAQVGNNTDLCMVEAAWFDDAESPPLGRGYYFSNPILKGGQTEAREVVEGTGHAYAVFKQASDCYEAARTGGGELWKTTNKISMSPGKTTMIVFSEANASKVETPDGYENAAFPRLNAK